MSFDIPVFYAVGAYNPWTKEVKQQWRHDQRTKQTIRLQYSLLENDEAMTKLLFQLQPGTHILRSPHNGLQLVLGILPWGDYAILVPAFVIRSLNIPSLPKRHTASEFLSLSPIYFTREEDLNEALKGRKERRAAHRTSAPINRHLNGAEPNAIKFAAFEHARLFYYSYFKGFRPAEMGIPAMFSAVEPKIVVLQFNFFQARADSKDMEDMLLDAAWGVVDFPSKTVDDVSYTVLNKVLNNPGRAPRATLLTGNALVDPDSKKLSKRLRAFFASLQPDADVIILTHDFYNLSRAICLLGLDDMFPQARTTTKNFKEWQSLLNDGTEWEGVGALVGYPDRLPNGQVKREFKLDPDRFQSTYDALRSSVKREESREASVVSSGPYMSASPLPIGGRETSIQSSSNGSFYSATSRQPSHDSRSASVTSDRYEKRADREYSRGSSVKQEGISRGSTSSRSETPLFRPRSRSPPSRAASSTPKWSRDPSSSSTIETLNGELEDYKIAPLEGELSDEKPFMVKEEDDKKFSVSRQGFAGVARRVFALDTQILYATSGRMWTYRAPLHRVAHYMGLRGEDEGICAGNELHDIWNIAKKLLEGPPVLFAKTSIDQEVKAQRIEEEYYKLEAAGLAPSTAAAPNAQGGLFGAPAPRPSSKSKRDFYEQAMDDDEDDDW